MFKKKAHANAIQVIVLMIAH